MNCALNSAGPETNSSHLKMDGWNTIVSFWAGLFSGVMLVSGSWKDFLNSVLRQKRILFPQSYTSPELSYTATCSSESIDFHYRDVAAGIVRLYRRKVTFKITWRGPVSVPRKVSYVAYTPCLSQKKEIRFKRFWALPLPCRSGCPSRCSHPKTGSERSWQYHTQNSQLHWNSIAPTANSARAPWLCCLGRKRRGPGKPAIGLMLPGWHVTWRSIKWGETCFFAVKKKAG